MKTAFSEFEQQMSKLTHKTERRLDEFDAALKKVEADTYWKIKDYEKLLEARPTLQYVKSAMAAEGREIFVKARLYTDDEILKLKTSAGAIEKTFAAFKLEVEADHRTIRGDLLTFGKKIEEQDAAQKDFTRNTENSILKKFDELHYKVERLEEAFKKLGEDGSSLQNSAVIS